MRKTLRSQVIRYSLLELPYSYNMYSQYSIGLYDSSLPFVDCMSRRKAHNQNSNKTHSSNSVDTNTLFQIRIDWDNYC